MVGVEQVFGVLQLNTSVDPLDLAGIVHVLVDLGVAEEDGLLPLPTCLVLVLELDLIAFPSASAVADLRVADVNQLELRLPGLPRLLQDLRLTRLRSQHLAGLEGGGFHIDLLSYGRSLNNRLRFHHWEVLMESLRKHLGHKLLHLKTFQIL